MPVRVECAPVVVVLDERLSFFRQATLSWVLARDCPSDGSIVLLAPEEFLALTGTINHRNDLHGDVYGMESKEQ